MIKILTKKKQVAIIKRLIANQYIFKELCPCNKEGIEALDKYFENTAEVISDIGGIDGLGISMALMKDLNRKCGAGHE